MGMIEQIGDAVSSSIGNIRDWWSSEEEKRDRLSRYRVGRTDQGLTDVGGSSYTAERGTHSGGVLDISNELMTRYADYENMDEYPEISLALDMYADNASMPDRETGKTIVIKADDSEVKNTLENLFFDRIDIEDRIWSICRGLGKYGSYFWEIVLNDDSVADGVFAPPATIRRVETEKGKLMGFAQDAEARFEVGHDRMRNALKELEDVESQDEYEELTRKYGVDNLFEPWKIVHFRLMDRNESGMYGKAVTEPARWVWKRLMMIEDSMLVFRLTRSPSRFVFNVEVGDRPPAKANKYLKKIKRRFSRKKFVDQSTGQLDTRYSPLAVNEDFYIPMEDGREKIKVNSLSTPSWQSTQDIEYFRKKLLAALKLPDKYLNYVEETRDVNVLAQEDPRFAMTVLRLQRAVKRGLEQTASIELAASGIDPNEANFEVRLVPPSYIFEIARMKIQNERASLARDMDQWFPEEWIAKNIFRLDDQEWQEVEEMKPEEDDDGGRFGQRARGDDVRMLAERIDRMLDRIEEMHENSPDVGGKLDKMERTLNEMRMNLFSKQNGHSMASSERELMNEMRSPTEGPGQDYPYRS